MSTQRVPMISYNHRQFSVHWFTNTSHY